jgi:outer membrane protein TolC
LLTVIPFLALIGLVGAAEPSPVPAAPPVRAEALDLAGCLALGAQHHPRIAAQRASLAAAEDGLRALEKLHAPALLAPELPTRRRQTTLGVTAAAAGLEQAQRETAYGVTRTYFTVLYARDQERVARAVVDRLTATRDAAQKALDAGARDVTAGDVKRASVYLRLAQSRRVQASQGAKRALAALKEAVGLGPETRLEVRAGGLPQVDLSPSRDEVVAGALARRGEVVRAVVLAQVTALEVEAQGTTLEKRMETFAAGSDIHAVPIPQKQPDGEYRPGAVPPEMPTLLAGSRSERVKRAKSFHARALAVVEATRHLVALEAEDAFLRWEEAALQARETREAADTAEDLARDLNKDFTSGLKVKVEEVANAWVLASQARAQYNEALYRQIVALADLERVTAGAFCPRLADLIAPGAPPAQGKEDRAR